MSAAYDTFDYPSYWIGRDYEHQSEVFAIRSFLSSVKKIKSILEVGAGFGRLAPTYAFRAKNIILTDPSSKTLKIARGTFKNKKNFKFIHSSLEHLPTKIKSNKVDMVVMIRVLHHIHNIDFAFKSINRILKPNGYIIFEFANKRNLKAIFKSILVRNFKFITDEKTLDIRSAKSIKNGTIPFLNYHPDKVKAVLNDLGFEIVAKRSVSNIRSPFLKKIFSTDLLLFVEELLQIPFSYFDLGPSIFILARKKG